MRALIQRVLAGTVTVKDSIVGSIDGGLVLLVGIRKDDIEEDVRYIVDKTLNLRIFSDRDGKFNHSALDVGAELLLVSQFTLYSETRKGRRPGFTEAASPEKAAVLFDKVVKMFEKSGLKVQSGCFQTHMIVSIQNDGPVTILLDSLDREVSRRDYRPEPRRSTSVCS